MSDWPMIRRSLAAFGLCISLASAAGHAQPSQDRASDRAHVNGMLQAWENAWNTHDMKAFAGLFCDDAIWVLWTGDVWSGRPTIERGMTEVHNTVYRTSIQRERLEELKFVGPDAAVVRFQSSLTGDARFPDRTIHSRKILVMSRRGADWCIAWGQNTRFIKDMQLPAQAPKSP